MTASTRRICAVLFLTGFLCTLVQVPLHMDATGFGQMFEAAKIAQNLAATGSFRDPFGPPTGPTAHAAPLYPFLLAGMIRVLGPESLRWGSILLNAILVGVVTGLLPLLSEKVYGRTQPGVVAGVLVALSGRLMPQWEVVPAAALLICATLAFLERGPVVSGVWAGASLLANPTSLPALLVLALWRGRKFAAIAIGLGLMICTPWIVRNWVVLGAPSFVRDNFGLELWISNNDQANAALIYNDALWKKHPNQDPEEAAVVARMGEAAYNKMRQRTAVEWIAGHPVKFLKLVVLRAWNYWMPSLFEGWTSLGAWIITLFGAYGVWLGAWRARRNPKSLLMAAVAIAYSLPFLLIQTVGRYRYPSLWACALLAGYGICEIEWGRKPLPRGRGSVEH